MTAATTLGLVLSATVTRLGQMTGATSMQLAAAASMEVISSPLPLPPEPIPPPRLVPMSGAIGTTDMSVLREPLTSGSMTLTLSDRTALQLYITDAPHVG